MRRRLSKRGNPTALAAPEPHHLPMRAIVAGLHKGSTIATIRIDELTKLQDTATRSRAGDRTPTLVTERELEAVPAGSGKGGVGGEFGGGPALKPTTVQKPK